MSQINYSRYKYIPDELDEKTFLEKFVVRNEIFNEIFEDIKTSDYNEQTQHYILIGQRGQGKTSLLRKIQLEIQNDKKLSKFLLPIKFAEEQYQIRTLCRLWEVVAEYLQNLYHDEFENILEIMEEHLDDEDYELECFSYLESKIKSENKKLVLLIDNIDEFLGKLKEKEQRQLREILLTSSSFKIIGGSTKMIEQHHDYAKPFYEFFKIIKLKGLNYDDSIKFLKNIAKDKDKEKIENIIKNSPQRIETIRQLTGGVPRTLVMLYDIFIDDQSSTFEDLLKLLNDVTPLYKERMDTLPPTLQDIVHNIAMNWDGITTKELAKKTRLDSKNVSSQLKQLEKYQIIEYESAGKNKIYKIRERFFNIWYLMRFGRKKDRNKVEWLVKFLTAWYSKDELEERAKKFIENISNKKMNEAYVYNMCEALSYSGLDIGIEHDMKQKVSNYFDGINSNLKNELSKSDAEILQQALVLYEKEEKDKAIQLLIKSKKNSKNILSLLGYLYDKEKDYKKAEEYYLKAIKYGDSLTLNNLAILYEETNNLTKSEEYYLKAIENGDYTALNNIAVFYEKQKRYSEAEKYYIEAIEHGSNEALNNFAFLNDIHFGNKELAEKYYLKAIENQNIDAIKNICIFYKENHQYEKAKKYFLKAIEKNIEGALNNFAIFYIEQKNYKKAEEYFLKALDNGDLDALNNIATLYLEQKNYKKAEEYFLKALDNGNIDALNNITNLYLEQKNYKKAEEYFLKALNYENNDALNNLSWFYFEIAKNIEKAVNYARESYQKQLSFNNTHTLATVLLWSEEFIQSYDRFIEWLEYKEALEAEKDMTIYLNLLISKGQLYKAKEFFEMEKYQLKDRYKPIWYALMTLMQDEFPNEIKKMGSELTQSVNEILEEIETLKIKYKID